MAIDPSSVTHRLAFGETTMIEIRPSVAVIGAGLAGLTAARVLVERGYPVTVFDKGRGPGGRATTRREGEFVFDHGCQYLTVRDARFSRYVETWVEQGTASVWPARLASCERGVVTPLTGNSVRWVGVPGMSALARTLATGMALELGVRVGSVQAGPDGWCLGSEQPVPDESYEVVIVAVPPEQAVPLLAAVPALQATAATVRMQPCWAALLAFEYDLELPFDAAFLQGESVAWAANNSSKPGRPEAECWLLHASPEWSREHLEETPEHVMPAMMDAFFAATGSKPLQPQFARAHRWRYALPENPLDARFLWDGASGMGVCGDWCHGARAESAFLSGLQLAERILADRPRAQR